MTAAMLQSPSTVWRADALKAMLRVATIACPALIGLGLALREPPRLDTSAAFGIGAIAILMLLHATPRLPFVVRASIAVGVFYAVPLIWLARSGFALGTAAAIVTAIVLAAIFLGRAAAVGLLLLTIVTMVAIGALTRAGHLFLRVADTDPRVAANWFRMAVTFNLIAAVLVTVVDSVVRRIEKNYADVAAALARLTDAEQRRATLESDRRLADAAWERCAQELIVLGRLELEAGDLPAAFRAITEAGARGLGVERCSVWLFDDARTLIRCQDQYERAPARHTRGMEVPAAAAPAYFAALEQERAIAANDVHADSRTRELRASYLEPLHITSMLDAPIRFEDRVAGVVCHEHVGPRLTWSVAQQSFAGSLADFAARALSARDRAVKERALQTANAELGQLNRRLESAKEDERRFIARELHDELGQTLTALKLRLKLSARGDDPSAAGGAGAQMLSIIDGLIDRVRKLSLDLRPPLLDEVGLIPAVRAYLDAQAEVSGVLMELEARPFAARSSPENEIACFRIVQEAVTNILRHADARRVSVRMEQQADLLRITVQDDGRGLAAGTVRHATAAGHMGLLGMRERARALGGDFTIRSRPGAGTTVLVTLPCGAAG